MYASGLKPEGCVFARRRPPRRPRRKQPQHRRQQYTVKIANTIATMMAIMTGHLGLLALRAVNQGTKRVHQGGELRGGHELAIGFTHAPVPALRSMFLYT